jgi:hypothetical protein
VFICLKVRCPTGLTVDEIYVMIATRSQYIRLTRGYVTRRIRQVLKQFVAQGRVGRYHKVIRVGERYFMVPFQLPPRGPKRNPTPKKVAGRVWRGSCNSCGLQLRSASYPEHTCIECGSGDVEWY